MIGILDCVVIAVRFVIWLISMIAIAAVARRKGLNPCMTFEPPPPPPSSSFRKKTLLQSSSKAELFVSASATGDDAVGFLS
jgi:hypothetical protein